MKRVPRSALHSDFAQSDASTATYSISDLCNEFAVTPRALRFYEDEGLLSPQRAGLSRVYGWRDRARLAWILRGKRVGVARRCGAVGRPLVAREPAFARDVALACFTRIRRRPGPSGRTQRDAIDRAGRDAELAARAERRKHGVHALGPADDRVDRTRGDAQRAADAGRFIDHRERKRRLAAA